MLIPVVCPDCAANFDIPDSYAGKKVRCPQANCGAVIAVPDLSRTNLNWLMTR